MGTTCFGCEGCTCFGPWGCKFCWVNCGYTPLGAGKAASASMTVFFLAAAHSVENNGLYQALLALAFVMALITAILLVPCRKKSPGILGDSVSLKEPFVGDVEDQAVPPSQET